MAAPTYNGELITLSLATFEDTPYFRFISFDSAIGQYFSDVDGDSFTITSVQPTSENLTTVPRGGGATVYTSGDFTGGYEVLQVTILDSTGEYASYNVAVYIEPLDGQPVSNATPPDPSILGEVSVPNQDPFTTTFEFGPDGAVAPLLYLNNGGYDKDLVNGAYTDYAGQDPALLTINPSSLPSLIDPEGDAYEVIGVAAANGTVTYNGNTKVTYQSNEGFVGEDTLTFTVRSSTGSVSEVDYRVKVVDPLLDTEGLRLSDLNIAGAVFAGEQLNVSGSYLSEGLPDGLTVDNVGFTATDEFGNRIQVRNFVPSNSTDGSTRHNLDVPYGTRYIEVNYAISGNYEQFTGDPEMYALKRTVRIDVLDPSTSRVNLADGKAAVSDFISQNGEGFYRLVNNDRNTAGWLVKADQSNLTTEDDLRGLFYCDPATNTSHAVAPPVGGESTTIPGNLPPAGTTPPPSVIDLRDDLCGCSEVGELPGLIQAGVEGIDYVYGQIQENNENNYMNRRGFTEEGDYWIKSKNGTDDLIGNGQEVAFIAGYADVINGTDVSTADILTGLEDGSIVATKSFTAYDGVFNIASFETPSLDVLLASGEEIGITRIDAETGEQLGGSTILERDKVFTNFGSAYNNSLSAQNEFGYGDILEANGGLDLTPAVDPII